MDRRTSLKWMLSALAAFPALTRRSEAAEPVSLTTAYVATGTGYGTDPDLSRLYKAGELWPLTFTPEQRVTAAVLSDLIVPADAISPSASQVGIVDFLDEWISAPYPEQQRDKGLVLAGFQWLAAQSQDRFGKSFAALAEPQQRAICDEISYVPRTRPEYSAAAAFFARYRDLTAGGFYTTAIGRKDLQYVGNTPSTSFPGPPPDVLRRVGLLG
jgi:hypothetical protein